MVPSKEAIAPTPLKFRLRTALVVPFVVQIVAAVGLVGYLSFRNGQKAVNELVVRLQNEASSRVEQHLSNYLDAAKHVAKVNTDALELRLLDPKNLKAQGQFYWKQMQKFNVGYISFGSTTGDYIGAGYHTDGKSIIINEVSLRQYRNSDSTIYRTDNQGNRIMPGENAGKYEYQKEPWYAETLKAGKPIWSQVYQWQQPPNPIAVSFNRPVRDQNNNIIGVIGIDQRLSQVSDFLRELKVSPSGKILIIERNGLIVATSSTEQPFTIVDGKPKRLSVLDSKDPMIAPTAQYLQETFGNFREINNSQQLELRVNNGNLPWQSQRQFIKVTPWRDKLGLDWLIVTVMPESDFMGQINANMRNTILLCLVALFVAIAVAIVTASWITRPILQIAKASVEMAGGNYDQNVAPSQIIELSKLANSFNDMSWQLKHSFEKLNEVIEKANQVGMKVTSSTRQITNAGKQLEATVTQQAVSTNEVKATATSIAATSGELAKTMETIAQKATATAEAASNSQASLSEMAGAMDQLATATTLISTRLGILNENANNISSVVTTIAKVADQTNLISLNAAIEAEKAGEYGVGFAVVAREVRRLADNTAAATLEIEEMVKEIQSSVAKGVKEMDKFSQQVSHHVEQVERISGQLASTIFQVQSLTPQFEAVSHSREGQFEGARSISTAISHLSEASQQTVASLQQTNQVMEQLNDTAQVLQGIISRKLAS